MIITELLVVIIVYVLIILNVDVKDAGGL